MIDDGRKRSLDGRELGRKDLWYVCDLGGSRNELSEVGVDEGEDVRNGFRDQTWKSACVGGWEDSRGNQVGDCGRGIGFELWGDAREDLGDVGDGTRGLVGADERVEGTEVFWSFGVEDLREL